MQPRCPSDSILTHPIHATHGSTRRPLLLPPTSHDPSRTHLLPQATPFSLPIATIPLLSVVPAPVPLPPAHRRCPSRNRAATGTAAPRAISDAGCSTAVGSCAYHHLHPLRLRLRYLFPFFCLPHSWCAGAPSGAGSRRSGVHGRGPRRCAPPGTAGTDGGRGLGEPSDGAPRGWPRLA